MYAWYTCNRRLGPTLADFMVWKFNVSVWMEWPAFKRRLSRISFSTHIPKQKWKCRRAKPLHITTTKINRFALRDQFLFFSFKIILKFNSHTINLNDAFYRWLYTIQMSTIELERTAFDKGKGKTRNKKKEKMPLTHANIRQIETKMLSGPMQIERILLLQIESHEFVGRTEVVAFGWLGWLVATVERLALKRKQIYHSDIIGMQIQTFCSLYFPYQNNNQKKKTTIPTTMKPICWFERWLFYWVAYKFNDSTSKNISLAFFVALEYIEMFVKTLSNIISSGNFIKETQIATTVICFPRKNYYFAQDFLWLIFCFSCMFYVELFSNVLFTFLKLSFQL